jgi:hypothetical protein
VTSELDLSRFPNFADSRFRGFTGSWLRVFTSSRLRSFLGSRFQTFARSRIRSFAGSRFQTFACPRLRSFAGSRFQTFTCPRLRSFAGSRFQTFARPMFLKAHFTNFINLDVSRVTNFPEFPNSSLTSKRSFDAETPPRELCFSFFSPSPHPYRPGADERFRKINLEFVNFSRFDTMIHKSMTPYQRVKFWKAYQLMSDITLSQCRLHLTSLGVARKLLSGTPMMQSLPA